MLNKILKWFQVTIKDDSIEYEKTWKMALLIAIVTLPLFSMGFIVFVLGVVKYLLEFTFTKLFVFAYMALDEFKLIRSLKDFVTREKVKVGK